MWNQDNLLNDLSDIGGEDTHNTAKKSPDCVSFKVEKTSSLGELHNHWLTPVVSWSLGVCLKKVELHDSPYVTSFTC